MIRSLCFIMFVFAAWSSAVGQDMELSFRLVDHATDAPIPDAHVFVSGGSIGTFSDEAGRCQLRISKQESQTIVISHLAYESYIAYPAVFPLMVDGYEIRLKSNGIQLATFELSAKRGSGWKKNLRRFRQALLGTGAAAAKCEILNPEVIQFQEENGTLYATAIDLLEIRNEFLGYDIKFWLDELRIDQDGSKYYRGQGQFISWPNVSSIQNKRRAAIYDNSLAHFLMALVKSSSAEDLKEYGYTIAMEYYKDGEFHHIAQPEPQALIQYDTITGYHQLAFDEFLKVYHHTVKSNARTGQQLSVSGAEQQKFGSHGSVSVNDKKTIGVSRLYKTKPYILFDPRGAIINKSALQEFHYWAEQRLATTLPIDYQQASLKIDKRQNKIIDTLNVLGNFVGIDKNRRDKAYAILNNHWSRSYLPPLLHTLHMSTDAWHRESITKLFEKHEPNFPTNYYDGMSKLWQETPNYGSYFAAFLSNLYQNIDPSFYAYFINHQDDAFIRLDEIVWGGVKQDGIPPLRSPAMISASEATYLADGDIVFGLVIGNQAYAYPKRILAWHEFFTAELQGINIAGVYCTLCGTVIIYDATIDGKTHKLGTSGFLYRSNKLMYDEATQSLWSTFDGRPVVGELVSDDIQLTTLPVATTTWGAWREKHHDTQVLSMDTGYDRDYAEGEAYREYFSTDKLMFPVPVNDRRLENKSSVFIPRPVNFENDPLAISKEYVIKKGLHHDKIGDKNIIIIADQAGGCRAYAINHKQFKSYKNKKLTDTAGNDWQVTDQYLRGPEGQQLRRIPGHEAFWFGWINAYPKTRLVH